MELSITKEDMKSYAEVNYIINHMNEKYFNKIPQKIKDFLYIVKDDSYETTININPAMPLTKQGISQYALEVIAIFHLKYWCENDDVRKSLLTRIENNHRKFEEQLRARYSNDVFGNNQASSSNIYQGLQDFERNIDNANVKSIQDIKANMETNYDEIEQAALKAENEKDYEQTVQDVNSSSAKNVQKAAEELTEITQQTNLKNFVMDLINKIKLFFNKVGSKKENTVVESTKNNSTETEATTVVEATSEVVEKVEEIKKEVPSE